MWHFKKPNCFQESLQSCNWNNSNNNILDSKISFWNFKSWWNRISLSFGQLLAEHFHLTAKSIQMLYYFLNKINNKLDHFCRSVIQEKKFSSLLNLISVWFALWKTVIFSKESDINKVRPLFTVLETCVSIRRNAITRCQGKVFASS